MRFVHSPPSGRNRPSGPRESGIASSPPRWDDLKTSYLPRVREALANSIVPFWWRAIDEQHGGVFNCWNNDMKLWWVHSEALYAALLCYRTTGDGRARGDRVWRYSFHVFPQHDRAVGEWIQIRDRKGSPLERVVALPVKDPYHVARNLIQMLELFSATNAFSPP